VAHFYFSLGSRFGTACKFQQKTKASFCRAIESVAVSDVTDKESSVSVRNSVVLVVSETEQGHWTTELSSAENEFETTFHGWWHAKEGSM